MSHYNLQLQFNIFQNTIKQNMRMGMLHTRVVLFGTHFIFMTSIVSDRPINL